MPGNIRLRASCDLQPRARASLTALATYAYVRVATQVAAQTAYILSWQHTLTCELRHFLELLRLEDSTGNIRLRASCDRFAQFAFAAVVAGNIRLRASCDFYAVGNADKVMLATYAYVRVATLSDRFRYQVTLRFICVWTSVQNGFSNSVSVSRRRTRTGHCSLRHFLPPCFAFEVRGFGRLGHALPL